jgi:alkylated DNA repair protein (DNA oxidative demethylase)
MSEMPGFTHVPGALDRAAQTALLTEIRGVIASAPLYRPAMPRTGKPLSVCMTNCGPLGWLTDKEGGYRYTDRHPETGQPWPAMPPILLELWARYGAYSAPPEACLVNYYGGGARLGSHRDEDEQDKAAPVVSISLGDDAVFHIGGLKRGDPKTRIVLRSGDIVVLGGASRLAFHGIDRIIAGTSDLLPEGGRFNLTLRRVTRR